MTTIQNTIAEFVARWNRNDALLRAPASEVCELEAATQAKLPEAHAYLVTEFGDVYSPNLLDSIVGGDVDLNDVQSFLLPKQMAEVTREYEEAGMPEGYLAFASDCMGNLFCFKLEDCRMASNEPPIWFFDHDFVSMDVVAKNYQDWLARYQCLP